MRVTRYSALTVIALAMAGCGQDAHYSPPKPVGLPASAYYLGGLDGGNWVDCSSDDGHQFRCLMYDNNNGRLTHERWFSNCTDKRVSVPQDLRMIDAQGLHTQGVILREYRLATYHPSPADNSSDIANEKELIEKYYRLHGVDSNCSPLTAE